MSQAFKTFTFLCCAGIIIGVLSIAFDAQSPAFGMASVKANRTAGSRTRVGADRSPAGLTRFTAANATLRMLLLYAYPELRSDEVINGPTWIDTARFDIEAKPDKPVPGRELDLMVRGLLEDRFALKARMATREQAVYGLVVSGKLKIKRSADQAAPSAAASAASEPLRRGAAVIRAERDGLIVSGAAVPIATLIKLLQQYVDRRLLDRTGLTGLFDFDVQFTPDDAPPISSLGDAAFPSIATALQEQLGLKLESTRGPASVLIVESARLPTDN